MDLPLGSEARDHQGLLAGVLAQSRRAVAYAQTRLLPAAHRQFQRQVVQRRVVHAHGAGVDPARHAFAARQVLGEDGRAEAVRRVVGLADRLVGVRDLHHRQRGAEGLFGHRGHRVVDVGEDGRFVEAPGARPAAAAGGHACARVARLLDVALDDLELWRERHRARRRSSPGRRAGPGAAPWSSRSPWPRTRRRRAPRRRRARSRCTSGRRSASSSRPRRWPRVPGRHRPARSSGPCHRAPGRRV